jgi:hypothetical protein
MGLYVLVARCRLGDDSKVNVEGRNLPAICGFLMEVYAVFVTECFATTSSSRPLYLGARCWKMRAANNSGTPSRSILPPPPHRSCCEREWVVASGGWIVASARTLRVCRWSGQASTCRLQQLLQSKLLQASKRIAPVEKRWLQSACSG